MWKIVVICVLIFILFFVIFSYNRLVSYRNQVQEAFATMDVYLKKRWDLIPNLVETVKGYAVHEKSVLEETMKIRSKSYGNLNMDEKIEASQQLSHSLGRLFAISENYPDLKASQNFLALGKQLQTVENDIASARKYYNATVRQYNTKVERVPTNIIAGIFHFTRVQMFLIEEKERENVQVRF